MDSDKLLNLVLTEMKDIRQEVKEDISELRNEIKELREDITSLKIRVALIGAAFGAAGAKVLAVFKGL